MNKAQTLLDPNSCLNKANADEPVFVLRAKDPTAAMIIRHWVTVNAGVQPEQKLVDAIDVANAADVYRMTHFGVNR